MANHNEENLMNLNLKIWRQKNGKEKGKIEDYSIADVSPDMSFLEMLDVLNENLVSENKDPVSFSGPWACPLIIKEQVPQIPSHHQFLRLNPQAYLFLSHIIL